MTGLELAFIVAAEGIGGAFLTAARRYNNPDTKAGEGISGWTLFLIIATVFFYALAHAPK
jgi:hypothetical protein